MEQKKEIPELITAYLRKSISDEEFAVLQEWLSQDDSRRKLLDELTDKKSLQRDMSSFASFDTGKCWKRVKREMDKGAAKRARVIPRWGTIAAVVAVAVLCGVFYWQGADEQRAGSVQVARILPGGRHAVLITEEGMQMSLQGMKDTTLILAGNERIKINENGGLKYTPSIASSMPVWHTLRVPRGGEFQVVLDDGTEVWLNSESELKYPTHFAGEERRVQLTGEAYFHVAREEASPFIVDTRDMEVKVLGTSFNVSVYPDETSCHATLLEGEVEVKDKLSGESVVLEPGSQAWLAGEGLIVRAVNAKLYSTWRWDKFTFASEGMEGVVRKLSRWYNVDFFFADSSMKQKRFTGSLPKYADVSRVLEIIEMTTDIKFRIKGNTIVIQ